VSSPRVLEEVKPDEHLALGDHRSRHRVGRGRQSTPLADHAAEMVEQIALVEVAG
jgi:hypothetical protein